jgi:hypothetical protein
LTGEPPWIIMIGRAELKPVFPAPLPGVLAMKGLLLFHAALLAGVVVADAQQRSEPSAATTPAAVSALIDAVKDEHY